MDVHDETIVAIATASGSGERGIIRISGPDTGRCVDRCFQSSTGRFAELRRAQRLAGHLLLDEPLGAIPGSLYAWPTARSYTRQPSAELHLVGCRPILQAAVDALCQAGARAARPGEFTLRAFLAGRLDLTQAEAVLGVIDAVDQRELKVALRQLAGGLGTPLFALKHELLESLAHLEAGLDFVDEDIEFITRDELRRSLLTTTSQLVDITEQCRQREDARQRFRIVLRGRANVGKSSLWNALIGQDQALVSRQAGTTRDSVQRVLQLEEFQLLLIDTAGIDDAVGPSHDIERQAQQQAEQEHQGADLSLLCLDASRALDSWEEEQLAGATGLVVWTKIDQAAHPAEARPAGMATSALREVGLPELRAALLEQLRAEVGEHRHWIGGTADRCRDSLRAAGDALRRATLALDHDLGDEVIALELRLALDELGRVLGTVCTDDLLDRIFSRFCIGK